MTIHCRIRFSTSDRPQKYVMQKAGRALREKPPSVPVMMASNVRRAKAICVTFNPYWHLRDWNDHMLGSACPKDGSGDAANIDPSAGDGTVWALIFTAPLRTPADWGAKFPQGHHCCDTPQQDDEAANAQELKKPPTEAAYPMRR